MASNDVRTYDADSVVVLVSGVAMTGLEEDSFVTITRAAPRFTAKAGADGEIARSKGTNPLHTVVITLQATSMSNTFLSGLATLDEVSNGAGAFPISVNDLRGGTHFMAAQAWISEDPEIDYGAEAGSRQWTIQTGRPAIKSIGGNG